MLPGISSCCWICINNKSTAVTTETLKDLLRLILALRECHQLFNIYATSEVKPFAAWQRLHFAALPTVSRRPTHLVFLRISSTSCLMWSSMNSIFSCLRASAFCRRTIRSTSTALSTSGKLSTTITDGPDWLSGERSSTLLLPPWRAFREPGIRRRPEFRQFCCKTGLFSPFYSLFKQSKMNFY